MGGGIVNYRSTKMQFQKIITLGNVLTIVSMVGCLITVYSQFKTDVAVMQTTIAQQQEVNKRHEQMLQVFRNEIREDIREIKADQRSISDSLSLRRNR